MDAWQRLVTALGRTLTVHIGRDQEEEPADAGHLAIQELVLSIGRGAGYTRRFELPTRSPNPSRSSDVGLIDPLQRRLVLVECVNTVTDFGDAVRASHRKQAELDEFATARGGTAQIGTCWVVRDVSRNRALMSRYPEIVASAFPGSSVGWLRALTTGTPPPSEPGLIWCDSRATRLFARRATR